MADSLSVKSKPKDIQRKQMLEGKTSHKGSYVKKKRIQIDYNPDDYQMKNLDVKYDIVSIISRINLAHAYQSDVTKWVINELMARKTQIPNKAAQILSIPGLSNEAAMRLLNLKNCVNINNQIPSDLTIPVPESIEDELQRMDINGLYGTKDSDPILLGDLVNFFKENYTEHKAIKELVTIASSKPGLDYCMSKLMNKPKITSSELAKALDKELHRKIDYPVKDPKFEEGRNRIQKLASSQLATFLAQSHGITKKAFLKEMGHQMLIETVALKLIR
jgi:hypothetical protein